MLLQGIIKRAGSLVASTIATSFIGNLSMGNTYIVIILNGQLYQKAYDEKGIDRMVLSRSVEEGSTLTTTMVPWNNTAVFSFATWAFKL